MPIAFALLAGALAILNPCGFAMLPAFLSFYVGAQNDDLPRASTRAVQGILVGLAVTVGFLSIFTVLGLPMALGAGQLANAVPWVGFLLGLAMVIVAIVTLAGKRISLPVRGMRPGGWQGRWSTMLIFGVGYGLASLGCTLPLFLVVLGASLTIKGIVATFVVFGAYALGMALVLMALSIGAALLRDGLARTLKRALPHVRWINGGLLLLVSAYLLYYWGAMLVATPDARANDPVITVIQRVTSQMQSSIESGAGQWVLIGSAVVVAFAGLVTLWQWALRTDDAAAATPPADADRTNDGRSPGGGHSGAQVTAPGVSTSIPQPD